MEKVNRQELQNALSIVKPGLANKELLEQTTSFAFISNRVVTYNDEISISHPITDIGFEGAIKAEELYGLLTKLSKDEIDISCDDDEVLIKCGRVKAGLKLELEINLPLQEEIGNVDDWKKIKNPAMFIKHLNFAMQTCSHDLSQPKLTCVCVRKNGYIQGSDGFRLVQCKGNKSPVGSYLIAANLIAEVIKLRPTLISSNDSWIHFKNDEDTIISCRTSNTDYVDQKRIDSILEMSDGGSITFPGKIDAIVDRVRQFAKRDFVFDEEVEVIIKGGKIQLSATTKETKSWIKESATIAYKGTAAFLITPMLLNDILKETRVCSLSKDNKRAKFMSEDNDWEYVVMLRGEDK